jgi:hypothetical protein
MPQYIRAAVPGGTFFFAVMLLECCGKLMMLKAGCAALSRPTGYGPCHDGFQSVGFKMK